MPDQPTPVAAITEIRLPGGTSLTVRRFPAGLTDLSMEASHGTMRVETYLNADQSAALVAALAPRTADLIEALERLTEAADAVMPSSLTDSAETMAQYRDCIGCIADARALLAPKVAA